MENEKQKEIIESSSKKKKFNLVIDYSKFQNNFMNNLKKEENKEKNNQEEKDNKINQSSKSKNYDQFLNVSEILNENLSQSSLNEQENLKNKNEADNNEIKENKSINKINKSLFNNNNILDNFSIGESDEPNLLGYTDLLMSYNGDNKRTKLDKNNKENDFNKTSLNSYRKKRNYVKFLNKNNLELKLSKTIDKEKTSYAKINEKNKLFKEKNYKNKFINKSDNFNNNSVLTLSDISNVPSTTTTIDFITGNTSKNFSNKSYYNNTNKVNNNLNKNKNNKNMSNKRFNSKENTYHSVNEIKLNNNNSHNYRKRKKSYEKQNNLMIYVNKKKSNEKEDKNEKDDLIYLLDNIKTKYKKQENKFISQQNNMKSEIEILREKLKTLSVNEALYQVEIEKLKRTQNNNEENNNINNKKDLKHSVNPSEKQFFEKKLDDIIMKHNKENNNINLYSFSKKPLNSNFEQLLEFFGLDKDLFSGDNIFLENEESFNYEKAFSEYPQIKKFIELIVTKYKNEKEYRTRLEEKTVEIFTNDMKTINILEKKIKKYEENNRHYKINSSLNASLDIGLSDNITKNSFKSCKSCDKMI